jgi:hypothetical protein
VIRVNIDFLFILFYFISFINLTILAQKDSRNGSDTSTSNRRPSIFTSSAIVRLVILKLQFRSNWR